MSVKPNRHEYADTACRLYPITSGVLRIVSKWIFGLECSAVFFAAGTDSDVLSSVNCSEVLETFLFSDF